MQQVNRVWWVDLLRGLACLSMPIFHLVHNMHLLGFTAIAYQKTPFWLTWQKLGLGTFVLVSGLAFILSSQKGIRWHRLLRRAAKLGFLAMLVSLVTWLMMPQSFVRFGVLHFFTLTIVLAPLSYKYPYANLICAAGILLFYQWMGRGGLYPEPLLYFTGMMSQRPPAADYIPLIPWFGVFMLGMGLGRWIQTNKQRRPPPRWALPIIWLGQHSLVFYFVHQVIIYAVLSGIRQWKLIF